MWSLVKLKDVCTLQNGRAYKKPELLETGKYPVLRVGNFFTSNSWYYSDLELDETKYCDNGDLLYAWSASFGARIWEGGKVIYHYHIWRVDFDESLIDKKFLYYWFEYDKEQVKKAHGTGTTMMHVSKRSMEQREILLPPLAEQQRIVAKLDAAFAEIDRAIESTRESIENALALRESTLEVVTKRNGTDTTTRNLGELFKLSSGNFLPKKAMNRDGSINVIGGNGLAGSHDEANLSGKHVVIGRVGAKCGNVHFINEDIWLTDNAMYAHSFSSQFDEEFLAQALASLNLGKYARQTAQPVISFSSIKDVPLTFPLSVSEQREIVSKQNEIQVLADSFIEIRSKQQDELNSLKSAILAQELQPPQSEAA